MKKRLKDIAEIRFCLTQKVASGQEHKTLTPIKLLENNVIQSFVLDDKVRADDTTKVSNGDIVVKRISPSFVNYIDQLDDDVYASGNLIIITATSVEPKYLAFILNESIQRITQSLSGAKIPAIGRSDLEEIQVPILSKEKQKAIGELWQKNIEIYKLKKRLNELELAKAESILHRAINGGKQNVK